MIDYTSFKTENIEIINNVYSIIIDTFFKEKTEKGWNNTHKFTNKNGINIYLTYDRFENYIKMFIKFSPHSISNNNIHNTNFFSLQEAQTSIIKTFKSLEIERDNFKYFGISNIEIGVNFRVNRDTYFILNSALLYSNYFFKETQFKHYKTATNDNDKYLKVKFYIKSEQKKTELDSTYYELGYCDKNIMRFELKLEKISKFKILDFSNIESLFQDNTEEILQKFILDNYEKMFFFNLKEIDTQKLKTKSQIKWYGKWQVTDYWKTLGAKERSVSKKKYNEAPKKFDLKKEIKNNIIDTFSMKKKGDFPHKTSIKKEEVFPSKKINIETVNNLLNSSHVYGNLYSSDYIDVGILPKYHREKKLCIVTGLNITMQKEKSKYLNQAGLEWLIEHDIETYKKLCEKYLSKRSKNLNLNIESQIEPIAHNIRNTLTNQYHNRKKFEQRNYPDNQLRFDF